MAEKRSWEVYKTKKRVLDYERLAKVVLTYRFAMYTVIINMIPFNRREPANMLDLGAGSGALTERMLRAFPKTKIVCVDGSSEMLNVARQRLEGFSNRVHACMHPILNNLRKKVLLMHTVVCPTQNKQNLISYGEAYCTPQRGSACMHREL